MPYPCILGRKSVLPETGALVKMLACKWLPMTDPKDMWFKFMGSHDPPKD